MGFWTSFCCPFKSPCLGSTKLILFYFKTTLVCYTFILKEISLNVRFSERWLNGGRPTGDVMSEKRGNPLDSRRMTSWPDLWKHCEAAAVLRSEICSVSPGNNTWRRNNSCGRLKYPPQHARQIMFLHMQTICVFSSRWGRQLQSWQGKSGKSRERQTGWRRWLVVCHCKQHYIIKPIEFPAVFQACRPVGLLPPSWNSNYSQQKAFKEPCRVSLFWIGFI